MSGPQYIVLPVQSENGQPLQVGSAVNVSGTDQFEEIAQTIQRKNGPKKQNEDPKNQAMRGEEVAESVSTVKQVSSDPSVLYSFINWDDPVKTLASFIAIMSLIISTHYLSPVQWALKILCIVLGITSLIEMVSLIATKDGIIARVRPQSCYRPSDRTYSRLFSELREAIDMTLVKLQTIIFAEDLHATGICFVLSFIAYWLVKAIPSFWLAVIATLLTYALGPVFTRHSSKKSNAADIKPVIDQKVQNLSNRAVDTASSLTDRAASTAQDLSSRAMDTASSETEHTTPTAKVKAHTMETAANTTDSAARMVQDLKNNTTERSLQQQGNSSVVG